MRFVGTIGLALACVAAVWAPAGAESKKTRPSSKAVRAQLKGKLSKVRTEIKETRTELRETKQQERKLTHQIAAVEDRILRAEERLARIKSRLGVLAVRAVELYQRMEVTRKRLENRRRVLARRVRENYQRGSASYVQVLLKSRSVHDYLSRSYYVERIVESDLKLVQGIKQDRRQLEADKKELDAQTAEQKELKADLENSRARYKADVAEKRELLEQVREERDQLEAALNELEESSNAIQARIVALQQTPRGRARLLTPWTGSFIKPADGPITSRYGMRFHPILHRSRLHSGVDIGAGYGSSIRAAAEGEVIFSGYMRGYGNTVIIDHGGGVSTLYAHCSALLVSEGQNVSRGAGIARVGSTGMSTVPHLHFEKRINGSPVNPM